MARRSAWDPQTIDWWNVTDETGRFSGGRRLKIASRTSTHELSRIASFRILLWWGVRTAMEMLRIPKVEARIIRVSKTGPRYPVASWFLADEKVCCIVGPEGRNEVKILTFLSGGKDRATDLPGMETGRE